ncbi:MAG: shikimate dehydrogenase [Nocardioides sp.]|uniref:shikimate dehydrogenase n=1 Tax=Nocardioides sp. TaxID=35761 RepID=UPI003EFC3CA3
MAGRRCGVLGDPIEHSLSPVLHRAGYKALGLDWTYDAHRVPSGGLAGFFAGLDDAWRGLSLTMPLKREAMALVDEVDAHGSLSGAVNTVVLDQGRLLGANTDVPGAVAAIRERVAGEVRTGVVLGGGATATSTGLALCDLGASEVTVVVRDPARARETVEAISAHPSRPVVRVDLLDAAGAFRADVVVSTVPAAAQGELLVDRCAEVPAVFDVIYHPWPTPLARSAEQSGRTLVGGLDLLVHQAVLQFELFTGVPGPLESMRDAGVRALEERSTCAD